MHTYIKPSVHVVAIEDNQPLLSFGTLHNSQGGTQLSKPYNAFATDEEVGETKSEDNIPLIFSSKYDWDRW